MIDDSHKNSEDAPPYFDGPGAADDGGDMEIEVYDGGDDSGFDGEANKVHGAEQTSRAASKSKAEFMAEYMANKYTNMTDDFEDVDEEYDGGDQHSNGGDQNNADDEFDAEADAKLVSCALLY
jgi:hypothetical protein